MSETPTLNGDEKTVVGNTEVLKAAYISLIRLIFKIKYAVSLADEKNQLIGEHKPRKKTFFVDDDVLSRWSDGLFYLGSVIRVDEESDKCLVRFEDNSEYWVMFKDLQKGAGEDSEIVCSLCENGDSDPPNEIVICDNCGFGFHQHCHNPEIPVEVLQPDYPWLCRQCAIVKTKNGNYLNKSPIGLAVQNFKCFPYDIKSLSWDSHHKTNVQQCYCYCGGPGEWYMKMLQCLRCKQWFHEACIEKLEKPMLFGDRFYVFVCYVCNRGNEFVHRLEMKWTDLAHLVIYNLTVKHHKKYFDFETSIMDFVDRYWDLLQLSSDSDLGTSTREDRKTNLLTALQNNKSRFKCGKEIKKKTTIWGLRVRIPPPVPKFDLPQYGPITIEVVKYFIINRRKKSNRKKKISTTPPPPIKNTKLTNGTSTPNQPVARLPARRGRPPLHKNKTQRENGKMKTRRRDTDLLNGSVETSKFNFTGKDSNRQKIDGRQGFNTAVKVKRKYTKRSNYENQRTARKSQVQPPNRMSCKSGYKSYPPINRSLRCQVVDGFENSSDDDDTTSHGTLDSFIPPPLNFEGHNHPFRNLDLFRMSISRPVKRNFRKDIRINKNGQMSQRGRRRRVNNVLLPNGYSSRFISSEQASEASMDTGSEFDVNGHENGSVDSMQATKLSFCDLKSSVNSYFGAANRIANGEKFNVLAKRVSGDGMVQYLFEWEGISPV